MHPPPPTKTNMISALYIGHRPLKNPYRSITSIIGRIVKISVNKYSSVFEGRSPPDMLITEVNIRYLMS